MRKIILITFITIFLSGINNLEAQTAKQPYGFRVLLGTHGYDGDLGNEIVSFASHDHLYGIGIAAYLHSYADLSFEVQQMTLKVVNGPNVATFERRNSSFDTENLNLNLMVRFKPLAGKFGLEPYIATGLGFNFLHDNSGVRNDASQSALSVPFGIGLNYKIQKNISLNIQTIYNRTFSNSIDNYPLTADEAAPAISKEELNTRIDFDGKDHDDFLTTSIGLVINFGGRNHNRSEEGDQPTQNVKAAVDSSNEAIKTSNREILDKGTLIALKELQKVTGQTPEGNENLKAEIIRIANNIQFQSGKDDIISLAYEELNSLTAILQEYKDLSISITVLKDEQYTKIANDSLSMRRAQTVKEYLVNKGIEPSRVQAGTKRVTHSTWQRGSDSSQAKSRSVNLTLSYRTYYKLMD